VGVAEAGLVAQLGELEAAGPGRGGGRGDGVDEEVTLDPAVVTDLERGVDHRLLHARRALLVVRAAHAEDAVGVRRAGEEDERDA